MRHINIWDSESYHPRVIWPNINSMFYRSTCYWCERRSKVLSLFFSFSFFLWVWFIIKPFSLFILHCNNMINALWTKIHIKTLHCKIGLISKGIIFKWILGEIFCLQYNIIIHIWKNLSFVTWKLWLGKCTLDIMKTWLAKIII